MTRCAQHLWAARVPAWIAGLACALLSPCLHAATLQVGSVICTPGQTFDVPVLLTRSESEAVAGIQCDFLFDTDHFSWQGATASIALQEAGKQLQVAQVSAGRWRVLAFGFNQNVIPAGTVFTLQLSASPSVPAGAYTVGTLGLIMSDPNGGAVSGTSKNGTITLGPASYHSADTNMDLTIQLGELLRGIQLFNAGHYHCDTGTEDGFAIGAGDEGCSPHNSDYSAGSDWRIALTELLRLIQFFNLRGYVPSTTTEDGYEPVAR